MAFTDAFRESTTLKLVVTAWALFNLKYMISGMVILGMQQPAFDNLAFAGGSATILLPWLHREWRKDRYPNT